MSAFKTLVAAFVSPNANANAEAIRPMTSTTKKGGATVSDFHSNRTAHAHRIHPPPPKHFIILQAVANFIAMGQEACGFPHNPNAVAVASKRLRLNRTGRGGMSAVHLAAFHGYADSLRLLLEAGSDPNAVSDDGETPLHTACNGGSILCATLLLEHGEFFFFFGSGSSVRDASALP